jgi:tetratricopeptide (TPR) repeat protein
MALKKSSINGIFACLVVVLVVTSVTSLYLKRGSSAIKLDVTSESSGAQLPENHPSTEVAEKMMSLEQKIAEEPQNPDYPVQIANLYYDLNQYDKAADFYQRSLDIRPENPAVETDLAACLHYLGQNDKALQTIEKVLKYSPDFPQAMFNKGIILFKAKNDIQGAIRVWEDLLQSDPAFSKQAGLEQMINDLKASAK